MSITKVKTRTLLLLLSLVLIVAGFLLLPEKAMADTEDINGITWTYNVLADGTVGVGGGTYSTPAVPTTTSGAITIPNTLGGKTVTQISDRAFSGCSKLTSITIPNSITSIGDYAFENCTALTSITIPDSVTSIGNQAFNCCYSFTSITIGNGMTSIGESAFAYCNRLTTINVMEDNQQYMSIDGVLFSKDETVLILYPIRKTATDYSIPNSVTSIRNGAFYNCSALTSVTVPNSVTSIGDRAFNSCTSLTSVIIPNSVTSIGEYAFYNCYTLASITIPDSVILIGKQAFQYCSNTTLTTPTNSVAHSYALANPTHFKAINVISTPTITITPSSPVSFTIGNQATIEATVSEGAAPYIYQWYFNNIAIQNATTPTLSIPSVTTADAGAYTFIVSGAMDTVVTSDPVSVTVTTEAPFALAPTANRNLMLIPITEDTPSESIALSSEATGGVAPYTYAWKKDGAPLTNTAPTLTISNLTTNDLGIYTVTITDANGTVITNEIVLRNAAAGITGDNIGTSEGTVMIGTIQPLQIKAVVPTVITFHVDPNEPANYTSVPGGALTAPSFSFQNACNAPLSFGLNSISAQVNNPAVVAESAFTDEEWQNLTISETTNNIAFGIVGDDQSQWQVADNLDAWYELMPVFFGDLQGQSSADLHLKAKYGMAWGNATEQTITYDVVYVIALAE